MISIRDLFSLKFIKKFPHGTLKNNAEHKMAEGALRKIIEERDNYMKELNDFMDYSFLISNDSQESELIKHIGQGLKEHFNPDMMAIFMLDKENNTFEVSFVDPEEYMDKLIMNEILLKPSLCEVIRTGQEVVVSDIEKGQTCKCMPTEIKTGGCACIPLIVSGTTVGVVQMIKKEKGYGNKEEIRRSLSAYARLAAFALHRVRLLDFMKRAALTDALTGIYNRRVFDAILEKYMALAKRYNEPLSLLIADLDHFKDFNDSYGHMAGDRALQQITTIMKKSIRTSDVLTRYGGEEFAIVMPTADMANAIMKAEEIRKSVESIDFEDIVTGKPIKITLSIGVASFPTHGTEQKTLINITDKALYQAKKNGRNRVETP